MAKNEITIDELARMVAKGFDGMDQRFLTRIRLFVQLSVMFQ